MRHLLLFSLIPFLISCTVQEESEHDLFIDLSSEIVKPRNYVVPKTGEALIIDGVTHENAWKNASFTEPFIDIEGVKSPKYDTRIKMLWDKNFLYVYAEMKEPHIWGYLKQRDTIIFYNNDFEVFIAPSGTTYNYGEIEINSLGTIWDLLLDRPYRDGGKANNHWNLNNLEAAVHIEGSHNDPSDTDSLWSVEIAIPMKALIELKNDPKTLPTEGEQWRINFSRVEWDFEIENGVYYRKRNEKGAFLPEYNWVWSNQKVINMHEPEKWGYLQFTNDSIAEQNSFTADENVLVKQVAYALFRNTKSGQIKHLMGEDVGHKKSLVVKYAKNDSLKATFNRTNFGFEYIINHPTSGQTFMINQSGTLKIRE